MNHLHISDEFLTALYALLPEDSYRGSLETARAKLLYGTEGEAAFLALLICLARTCESQGLIIAELMERTPGMRDPKEPEVDPAPPARCSTPDCKELATRSILTKSTTKTQGPVYTCYCEEHFRYTHTGRK